MRIPRLLLVGAIVVVFTGCGTSTGLRMPGGPAPVRISGITAFSGIGPVKYYVDRANPNCSDSGAGTETQPFCTIGRAARVTKAGETAQVAAGTYAEEVSVANSGSAGAPVALVAAPGATVTVTGQRYGFRISGRSWVTIRGFTVTRTTDAGIYVYSASHIVLEGNTVSHAARRGGIYLYLSSYVTVQGSDVSYSGTPSSDNLAPGIVVRDTTDTRIANNSVHHNSNHGIYVIYASTRVEIVGNRIFGNDRGPEQRGAAGIEVRSRGNLIAGNIAYDNQDSGINLRGDGHDNLVVNNVSYNNRDHGIDVLKVTGNRIIGNTVYKNAVDGISVEGGSTGTLVANNISVDNGINNSASSGNLWVSADSIPGTTADHDILYHSVPGQTLVRWGSKRYSSLAAFVAATGMERNGIEADPRWRDPAGGDFRLLEGSPAIDSADSGVSGQQDTDAEGRPRRDDPGTPNTGTGPRLYDDRGAYEY
ncbi:MAG: right-handed parallel beta-helix repeat-containing protein [Armatimonadota bacterium]|nr:right-handed parallel beta-helix repeat-containing protein [Armatimonadota bacterium]MDR5697874.1 right-handed parallel beta-helix repeat-containing protein [Armatimonadota bacterium]